MKQIWLSRLWGLAAGMFAMMLAAMGLALILSAAGDQSGKQAMFGVSAVTGLAFVAAIVVLSVYSAWWDVNQSEQT